MIPVLCLVWSKGQRSCCISYGTWLVLLRNYDSVIDAPCDCIIKGGFYTMLYNYWRKCFHDVSIVFLCRNINFILCMLMHVCTYVCIFIVTSFDWSLHSTLMVCLWMHCMQWHRHHLWSWGAEGHMPPQFSSLSSVIHCERYHKIWVYILNLVKHYSKCTRIDVCMGMLI